MSKIVIDFKHEDVHQPRPWPVGIVDGIATSGLGQDDGAILVGFAKEGVQGLSYMPEEIESIDFDAQNIVPIFSNAGGLFNWNLPIRGFRTIEEVITDRHFTLDIQMSNDATQNGEDIAEILVRIARDVEQQSEGRVILDANGERVGTWGYSEVAR